LRETFPEAGPYGYVILDRDSKFDADVIAFLKVTDLKPAWTSVRAPWQNGIAEIDVYRAAGLGGKKVSRRIWGRDPSGPLVASR
jgi:hypothetical protein